MKAGSILYDLYYGKIVPSERRNLKKDEEQEIVRQIAGEEKYFTDNMCPDDCARFHSLSELYSKLLELEESEIFSYAFTMGAFLMEDMMNEAGAMKTE